MSMNFLKLFFITVICFFSLKTYGADNYMCTMNDKGIDGNIIETKITFLKEDGKNSYLLIMKEGSIPLEVFYEGTEAIYIYDKVSLEEGNPLYILGINKKTGFLTSTGVILEEVLPSLPNTEVERYSFGKCDINP